MKYFLRLSLLLFLACKIQTGYCQYLYQVSQVKHYFTFYKNQKDSTRLNDTITATSFKSNDSGFIIKFYTRKKLTQQCACKYTGRVEIRRGIWYEEVKGKLKPNYREYSVKKLDLVDSNCVKFLPSPLLQEFSSNNKRIYLDSVSRYAASIDSAVTAFDLYPETTLRQTVSHYNHIFCGGGTVYLHKDSSGKVLRIFYDSNCGDLWVEKKFYFNDNKILLIKTRVESKKQEKVFEKMTFYRKNKRLQIVTDELEFPKFNYGTKFSEVEEGYYLLKDNK